MTIEVLDAHETEAALSGGGGRNQTLHDLAEALTPIADTGKSVWYEGSLSESFINMLRTKMDRRGLRLTARKASRDGKAGHILRSQTK